MGLMGNTCCSDPHLRQISPPSSSPPGYHRPDPQPGPVSGQPCPAAGGRRHPPPGPAAGQGSPGRPATRGRRHTTALHGESPPPCPAPSTACRPKTQPVPGGTLCPHFRWPCPGMWGPWLSSCSLAGWSEDGRDRGGLYGGTAHPGPGPHEPHGDLPPQHHPSLRAGQGWGDTGAALGHLLPGLHRELQPWADGPTRQDTPRAQGLLAGCFTRPLISPDSSCIRRWRTSSAWQPACCASWPRTRRQQMPSMPRGPRLL